MHLKLPVLNLKGMCTDYAQVMVTFSPNILIILIYYNKIKNIKSERVLIILLYRY